MKAGRTTDFVKAAVALSLGAAAVAWAAWLLGVDESARRRRIEDFRAQLKAIEDLEARLAQFDPYWRALETAQGTAIPPEELWAAVTTSPVPWTVTARKDSPLRGSWILRHIELNCPEVSVEQWAAFIHACGTTRPPWRVAAIRLQALDPQGQKVQAVATLETAIRTNGVSL